MRVLVCGGRDYRGDVARAMDSFHQYNPITLVIHGGANGADMMADTWARSRGIHTAKVDALWDHYGKSAGYRRNSAMLKLEPSWCIAFPGGVGTQQMVKLCKDADIRVWVPYD